VTSITVSDEFEEKRTLVVVDSPFPGVFDGLFRSNDVHPVDLFEIDACQSFVLHVRMGKDGTYPDPRNFVTAGVVVGVGGAAGGGGTHTVLVVLADEDGG
jgi:hypothetical protein